MHSDFLRNFSNLFMRFPSLKTLNHVWRFFVKQTMVAVARSTTGHCFFRRADIVNGLMYVPNTRANTRFSLSAENEQADAGRGRPFSGANGDTETFILSVQLTTSRVVYKTGKVVMIDLFIT